MLDYPQKECVGQMEIRRATPLEQLTRRKQQLENELQRINEALDILQKYPDITKVMEVVARAL